MTEEVKLDDQIITPNQKIIEINERVAKLEESFNNLPNVLNEILQKTLSPLVDQIDKRFSTIESRITSTPIATGGFNWGTIIEKIFGTGSSGDTVELIATKKRFDRVTIAMWDKALRGLEKTAGLPEHTLSEHP